MELFPSAKELACDPGPTRDQCYVSSQQLSIAAKHTLFGIARKLIDISLYEKEMTSNDYDLITADLSDLAMHACVANQYVAHLACKNNATRKTLEFIDYMKAACRHLDKARRNLEQYE
jgi:hypothetical protein